MTYYHKHVSKHTTQQIDSNEGELRSPPSKRRRLTYEEKGLSYLTNELQRSVIYLRVLYDVL